MRIRTPLLVALVVALAGGSLAYFVVSTNKDTFSEESTTPYLADFHDAVGIRGKTRIQISGVDVGAIVKVEHVRERDGKLQARVSLRILKEFDVYEDAEIHKAAESMLGDFRLDLDPGTPDGHRKLQPGELIPKVFSLTDMDEIQQQLLEVSENANAISESFADVLAGPAGEGTLKNILEKLAQTMANIEHTTGALEGLVAGNQDIIARVIVNVGHVTEALATIAEPGGDVTTLTHNLMLLSAKLDHLADSVNTLLGASTPEVPDGPGRDQPRSLQGTLANLRQTLVNVRSIAAKIEGTDGTLGYAINDSTLADKLEITLDSANAIVGNVSGLQVQIELRSEYDVPFALAAAQVQPSIKNTIGMRVYPTPDKFYILEAVSDPRGKQTHAYTASTVAGNTLDVDQTVTSFDDFKFNLMLAKRYYFATLRFGITENTGGLGLDMHAFSDRAEVRFDAYDFDRQNPATGSSNFPRFKVTGLFELAGHVHVQLGVDDAFNPSLRTWFLGGVLRFNDDDFKSLLIIR